MAASVQAPPPALSAEQAKGERWKVWVGAGGSWRGV